MVCLGDENSMEELHGERIEENNENPWRRERIQPLIA